MSRVVMRLFVLDPLCGYVPPLSDEAKRDAIAKATLSAAMGKEPELGPYLKFYDPDGNWGAGKWEFTDNKAEARVFASLAEATLCWKQVSRLRPRRIDGRPNRPLTMFNVTFEDAS